MTLACSPATATTFHPASQNEKLPVGDLLCSCIQKSLLLQKYASEPNSGTRLSASFGAFKLIGLGSARETATTTMTTTATAASGDQLLWRMTSYIVLKW